MARSKILTKSKILKKFANIVSPKSSTTTNDMETAENSSTAITTEPNPTTIPLQRYLRLFLLFTGDMQAIFAG